MQFQSCIGGGDAFSIATIRCNFTQPCLTSMWYKAGVSSRLGGFYQVRG